MKIKKITKLNEKKHVYDLSVKDNNNFFITSKEILTHNCDYITTSGQAALRNVMETFSKSTRFILTCNYVERIIEPIQSRCQTYQIFPPSKKDVALYVKNILDSENISFEKEDFKCVIDSHYPDIRKIINFFQLSTTNNILKVDRRNIIENDGKLKLLEILKEKKDNKTKFTEIRQLIADNQVHDFTDWYSYLYENLDSYCGNSISSIILILSESEYRSSFVVDKEITFMSCIVQILKELK